MWGQIVAIPGYTNTFMATTLPRGISYNYQLHSCFRKSPTDHIADQGDSRWHTIPRVRKQVDLHFQQSTLYTVLLTQRSTSSLAHTHTHHTLQHSPHKALPVSTTLDIMVFSVYNTTTLRVAIAHICYTHVRLPSNFCW